MSQAGWCRRAAADPGAADLTIGNSIWLGLRTADGGTIAWIAGRMFETRSVDDLVRSGRIWHPPAECFDLGWEWVMADREPFGGRCWHQGGLDVEPEWRGRAAWWLPAGAKQSVRYRALRGRLVLRGGREQRIGVTDLWRKLYGYKRIELAMQNWDVAGEPQDLYITDISRGEVLRGG